MASSGAGGYIMLTTMLPKNISGNHSGDNCSTQVSADEPCTHYLFVVYVLIYGPVVLFGLIGNTISYLVLQWEKQNHVATFLLQSLAMADNSFLLTAGFSQIFTSLSFYIGYGGKDNIMLPYMAVSAWPLVHITQMITVWMTVLIAVNRYVAICKPFQAPMLCTITRVRLQVAIIIILSIIYNIPRFLEFKISDHVDKCMGVSTVAHLVEKQMYKVIYENILYAIFIVLGPLVILVVLNACLIKELMKARRKRIQRGIPGEEDESNITLVMVIIVLIFVICQTPALINHLLNTILPTETFYQCGKPYYTYFHISNLIVTANSSVNFFVYFGFRKQFRQRLKAFCYHKPISSSDYEEYSSKSVPLKKSANGSNMP